MTTDDSIPHTPTPPQHIEEWAPPDWQRVAEFEDVRRDELRAAAADLLDDEPEGEVE